MINKITLENEIFEALQMARTNPLQMAKEIFSSMSRNLNSDGRLHFDWGIVETQQGKSAYEDAINFLSKKAAQKSFAKSVGLYNVVKEHAGKLTKNEHQLDAKSMEKHGLAIGSVLEVVEYGPWRSGMDWCIAFLVDDGKVHKKHREYLLDPKFSFAAVGLDDHEAYGSVCVIAFAEKFIEFDLDNGVVESQADILNRYALVMQRFWRNYTRRVTYKSKHGSGDKDAKQKEENAKKDAQTTSVVSIFKASGSAARSRKVLRRKNSVKMMNDEYEAKLEKGKKRFAERIVYFSYFVLIVEAITELLTGVQYDEICIGLNTYLLVLVWSDTLTDEKRNQRLTQRMCVCLLISSYCHFFGNIDRLNATLWCRYFVGFPAIVGMIYLVLREVAYTLRGSHEDLESLAKSTTARVFHGLPLLLYFMTELFSSEHSRKAIVNVLCQYMPGAKFDKDSHLPMSIHRGEWKECEYAYIIATATF